jgi:hypothetical protein
MFCGSCGAAVTPALQTTPNLPPQSTTAPATPQVGGFHTPTFVPPVDRTPPVDVHTLSIALCVTLAVAVLSIAPAILAFAAENQPLSASQQDAVSTYGTWTGVVIAISAISSAVLFMTWSRKLHKNVTRMGVHGMRFGSDQTIWPWFVPFLNLGRPARVINDIARGLKVRALIPGNQPIEVRASMDTLEIVPMWWTAWLIASLIGRFLSSSGPGVALFGTVLWGAAAIVTIAMVWQMNRANRAALVAFTSSPGA